MTNIRKLSEFFQNLPMLVLLITTAACDKISTDDGSVEATEEGPKYTLTYNGNGATSGTAPIDDATYSRGTSIVLPTQNDLARVNHTFVGWCTMARCSAKPKPAGEEFIVGAGNTTFFAQWELSSVALTLESNGGDENPQTKIVPIGATYNLPANTFTKPGCTFAAWNTSADGRGTSYANLAYFSTPSTNVTLYAQWSLCSKTVTFAGNDATSGAMTAQTFLAGSTAQLTANSFTKTGYTFSGWNTAADGSGTSYANQALYTAPAIDVTLYAQWTPLTYAVSFNGNSASSGTMADKVFTYNVSSHLSANGYSKTGYTFSGWNTAADGSGTSYANQASYTTPAIDVTLYAQWTPLTYTVSFNGNGASSGTIADQVFTYSVSSHLSANGYSKTGYTFSGWNTAADGSGTSYANQASYTTADSNSILYAQWLPATFSVTFNGNGATSGSMSVQSFTFGTPAQLSANSFSLPAYTFSGWNTAPDGTGTGYADQASYATGAANITLFAQWTFTCTGLSGGTWVRVPGDSAYETNDFCVMKYFASNVSSTPVSQVGTTGWVSISQADARIACSGLGTNYHLLTNKEWMTIGANAAAQTVNWSGAAVGSGMLARGHSDNVPNMYCEADVNDLKSYVEANCTGGTQAEAGDTFEQRRTHYLSNGSVIWDFNGMYWQWVDYNNETELPHSGAASYIDYPAFVGTDTTPKSDLVPLHVSHDFWDDNWDSSNSIGKYYPGTDDSGEGAMVRGGGKNIDTSGGLFATRMNYGENDASKTNISFRCAYTP